jgi:nucleoid DNA-binding protein
VATKTATPKPASKSEVLATIASRTGLSRKQVSSVVDALSETIAAGLGKKGPGVFVIPGIVKIYVKHMPAKKAEMRPNPFKPGEMMEVKARPARNVVKVRPLKKLKEMA